MKKPRNSVVGKGNDQTRAAHARQCPQLTVLHIDDDRNDTELFRAAARKANAQFSIHTVSDAEQAMAYLNGRDIYANRKSYPIPALVLLDLKMPRATGFEVLSWIRNHPEVGNLPVVVFSGSELQADIQRAYAAGADSYLVKPLGFNELVNLVKSINSDWIAGEVRQSASVTACNPYRLYQDGRGWPEEFNRGKARP